MFRAISYRIALQFTAFVFILLLVNGALFLAADVESAKRQTDIRMDQTAKTIIERIRSSPAGFNIEIAPQMRERVRIINAEGQPVLIGAYFDGLPVETNNRVSRISISGEPHNVYTFPVERSGTKVGYIQMLDAGRPPSADLPLRALLYLIVSASISALTFSVGLFFARRSLKPAEEMMQRLEQFTQDASHELRTPVAALSSSLDLALRTKKFEQGIVSAKDDLKDISSLIERLLELARIDKALISTDDVDLSALTEKAAERSLAAAKTKHVTVERKIEPGIHVRGDASLLMQVLTNLLTNAIKFSNDEGIVTVTLAKNTLSIRDEGIGISMEDLPHIFDRFFQADESRSHGGYGLGLAMAKRIAELHGWTISVESEKGKGSEFKLAFSGKQK